MKDSIKISDCGNVFYSGHCRIDSLDKKKLVVEFDNIDIAYDFHSGGKVYELSFIYNGQFRHGAYRVCNTDYCIMNRRSAISFHEDFFSKIPRIKITSSICGTVVYEGFFDFYPRQEYGALNRRESFTIALRHPAEIIEEYRIYDIVVLYQNEEIKRDLVLMYDINTGDLESKKYFRVVNEQF